MTLKQSMLAGLSALTAIALHLRRLGTVKQGEPTP